MRYPLCLLPGKNILWHWKRCGWRSRAAYDDEQLAPYAGDIRLLLGSDKPLYVTEAVSVAYDRLEMVAKTNLTVR